MAARYPENYVRPDQFAAHMAYLRFGGFTPITFGQYLAYRRNEQALPTRPIFITFDDGYRESVETAAAILERFGFPATVFVVSGLLGQTNSWDPEELQEPLVAASDVERLQARGLEFQSHTATHARLPALADDVLRAELARSRADLAAITGRTVDVIAYPWGEHDERVRRVARECGYAAGVTLRRRTNFNDTPLLELRRIGINHGTTLGRFAWDLARLRYRGDS